MSLYNALIRTHHITSRKKVAALRHAAKKHNVFALLKSGGPPGVMYVEGGEGGVKDWVETVHRLRYKDYHLAIKPAPTLREAECREAIASLNGYGHLEEIESIKDFSQVMARRDVLRWWRRGMGYDSDWH